MKRTLTLLLSLFITIIASAQNNPSLEAKNGYKNIILGQSIGTINEKMWPIRKDASESDKMEWYKYASRKVRQIGNVKLKRIVVKAFNDRIMEIVLQFNPADRSDIMTTLISAYGTPIKDLWDSETITLSINDNRAIFKSKQVSEEYRLHKTERAKQAASDL